MHLDSPFRRLRRLACLVALAAAAWPCASPARTLLENGSNTVWRFLDTGSLPPAGWLQPGFDDSHWNSGPAPLGYGEPRLATTLRKTSPRPVTTWFRREFVTPALGTNERAVVLLCVDDGAVVHLNGRELARVNLPTGPLQPDTLASRELGARAEGRYVRLPVPARDLRPGGTNVVAVEVHQATTNNADLFFDLALKTLPADTAPPTVTTEAKPVLEAYYKQHYVDTATRVPDGYFDGGRHMQLDAAGRARSGREILLVDRDGDPELQRQIEFARSAAIRDLPERERIQRLAAFIDARTTPPGGPRWTGPAIEDLTREFANQSLRIGDVIEQSQAGVCRHRSLLFKILGDEAGLKTALVRGNYARRGVKPGFAHAWNEVTLSDGRRVLVDVMHHGGKAVFPEITSPEVVSCYLKEDDTPWYAPATAPASAPSP